MVMMQHNNRFTACYIISILFAARALRCLLHQWDFPAWAIMAMFSGTLNYGCTRLCWFCILRSPNHWWNIVFKDWMRPNEMLLPLAIKGRCSLGKARKQEWKKHRYGL